MACTKNCLTKKGVVSMLYKDNMLQNACENYKLLSNKKTKKIKGNSSSLNAKTFLGSIFLLVFSLHKVKKKS
jgi:hypothetical protein